jgi:hypothetical protein
MFREDEISTSLAPILSMDVEYLDENSFTVVKTRCKHCNLGQGYNDGLQKIAMERNRSNRFTY